jgi:hypothetical protein
VELLFRAGEKKTHQNERGMKIQECGRTGTGQPSPLFLQIANNCPDWQGKFATIYKFFNWRSSNYRPAP